MNSRNRLIVLALGVLSLGGLLAAGYVFLAEPYLQRMKSVKKMEDDAQTAQDDLDDLQAKTKKLKGLRAKSLPAGPLYPDDPKRTKREYADVARAEYEQALTRLLRDSGARNATVDYIDGDSNNKTGIPQIDPNAKPNRDADPSDYLAYTQVVFKIGIPKTDLDTVAAVLRRYYALDLLHQITQLNIKQTGTTDLTQDKRPYKERTDLKVELTTRAIIVHDAPRRRSLTAAPTPLAGLVGGSGAVSYEQSTAASRALVPTPVEPTLASKPIRDYGILAAKDLFHGGLYNPPPDTKPAQRDPDPIRLKPDFREFIVFTTSIHTIEGDEHTLDITVKDKINKEDYNLVLTQSGEKVRVKVYKWEYQDFKVDAAARKKKVYSQDTLEISKYTMINKNDFTVYGVDTDGSLILGEKPTGLSPELSKDDKTQPVRGAGGGGAGGRPTTRPSLPPADPKAAVVGGMVVTAPKAEKFYRWEYGKSLKQIVELSKGEAEKAIRRAQTRFLPAPDAKTTSTPPPEVKSDKP